MIFAALAFLVLALVSGVAGYWWRRREWRSLGDVAKNPEVLELRDGDDGSRTATLLIEGRRIFLTLQKDHAPLDEIVGVLKDMVREFPDLRHLDLKLPPRYPQRKIQRPPGFACKRIADLLFSKRTRDRVLYPTLADTEHEYFEALAQGRFGHARWIKYRGAFFFGMAVLAHVARKFVDIVKPTSAVAGRGDKSTDSHEREEGEL